MDDDGDGQDSQLVVTQPTGFERSVLASCNYKKKHNKYFLYKSDLML